MTVTKAEAEAVHARRAALLDAIRGGCTRYGALRAKLYRGDHRKFLLRTPDPAGSTALESDLQALKRQGLVMYDDVKKRWSAVALGEEL